MRHKSPNYCKLAQPACTASHNSLFLSLQSTHLKPLISPIFAINQAELSILIAVAHHVYSEMNSNSRNERLPQPESASLCKSKHAHTIDRMGPPPPIDSEDKFGPANFKAEALHAQPKPATANEAKSTFTFSARVQGLPKIKVTDVPFPRLLSTEF